MLLDDSPIVPGDKHAPFEDEGKARQILADAEDDLRAWVPNLEPIPSRAGELSSNAMPGSTPASATATTAPTSIAPTEETHPPASDVAERGEASVA